jgi:hypothetical protein
VLSVRQQCLPETDLGSTAVQQLVVDLRGEFDLGRSDQRHQRHQREYRRCHRCDQHAWEVDEVICIPLKGC